MEKQNEFHEKKGLAEISFREKELYWSRIIEIVVRCFAGRFFAFGDTCIAAIHYKNYFESMENCAFAALRADYDFLLPKIAQTCEREGLIFERYACIQGQIALYSRIGLEAGRGGVVWVNLYPLDNIPNQLTLRFKLFREARKKAFFSSEKKAKKAQRVLQRYNQLDLSTCACLCGGDLQRNKTKRTVFQRTVIKEDLFPVRNMKLGKIVVPVSKRVSNWTDEPTPERLEAISIVQRESLESLKDLDEACRRMGIRYFLVGGTLLGAIRNQGFIPWDDDTDIGLLRSDYKRFCKEAEGFLNERYFIQTMKRDRHFNLLYARLRRAGVEYISNYNEDKRFNKGIWVDLFPFDAVPENKWLAKNQKRWGTFFARIATKLKRRHEYAICDIRDNTPIAVFGDRVYLVFYWLFSFIFPITLCNGIYQMITRCFNLFHSKKTNRRYACFNPSYTTISDEELQTIRQIPFEGLKLEIPFDAEAFLSRQYGNYKVEPILHERFSNHGFKYLIIHDDIYGKE